MYKDLENSEYDFVIIGTGTCESIISSYLSKCGKKIIHFDISKYYGGECKNFSCKDLDNFFTEIKIGKMNDPHLASLKLVEERYESENFYQTEKLREYNFDFNPKFLYGKSKATEELASTRASQYMEFVSVKKIYLRNVSTGKFMSVPCSKSDIFNSDDLQLSEKQKLLNLIHAVMKLKNSYDVNTTVDLKKDYEVENKIFEEMKEFLSSNADEFLSARFSPLLQDIIRIVLANLDPNLRLPISIDNLADEIYKYLNSLLVYDITPFIYPLYGSSEFSQALCRMSSVFHTIFIVNESISIEIFNNNEFLVDNVGKKRYVINIHDSNCDQSFSISTSVIICNENFLPQNNCQKLNFHDKILESNLEISSGLKFNQFISYYVVENNNVLRNLGGPNWYKVPKNDPFYKNEFGFIAYEFDQNSYSAPKYRTLVQVIITSEASLEPYDIFISKSKEICNSFISSHLERVRDDIQSKLNNLDTLDSDVKKYVENNIDNLHTEVQLLATIQFYRELNEFNYKYFTTNEQNGNNTNNDLSTFTPKNIIITKNNYTNNHLDSYFEEAEKIIKSEKWNTFEPIEVQSNYQEYDESDRTDNLIDELFDSIELNK